MEPNHLENSLHSSEHFEVSKVAEVITLQYYIHGVFGLNIIWHAGYPYWDFCGFSSDPPWDAGLVPQIRSWPCPI